MSKNTEVSIEFRIKFKDEYGIDYKEAVDDLVNTKKQSEREWTNYLISIGVIK